KKLLSCARASPAATNKDSSTKRKQIRMVRPDWGSIIGLLLILPERFPSIPRQQAKLRHEPCARFGVRTLLFPSLRFFLRRSPDCAFLAPPERLTFSLWPEKFPNPRPKKAQTEMSRNKPTSLR